MALSVEEVRAKLLYDAETGTLTWKARPVRRENPGRRCDLSWNTQHAGKQTGYVHCQGYVVVNIGGTPHRAHRLIWAIVHGRWPKLIDHVNRVRDDNRLCNLREASPAQNLMNKAVRADSKVGIKGVQFHPQTGKWRARLRIEGENHSLGLHESAEAAHQAYNRAAYAAYGEFAIGGPA